MPKISVIISSLRPDRLEETIDSTAMHSDLVEVVVASPTPPRPRDFVKHVPVPKPGDPNELTFTQKNNLAVQHASGEYLVYNNDDIHFRPGWAKALIQHMEREKAKPYLAAFHLATKGKIVARHTAFGMLYANHGCIRKSDLKLIGGTLFDERYFMYNGDVDIGLRVWYYGGKVGMCEDVVLDNDRDVDQAAVSDHSIYAKKQSGPIKKARTYRDVWIGHDSAVFLKIWFPRYFWLFLRNYKGVREKLATSDGVLPPKRYHAGLLKIMFWPVFNMFLNPRILLERKKKMEFVCNHWVRIINRRWSSLNYHLPYDPRLVSKGLSK